MNLRRIAFLSLRLLALFFVVRGLEVVINAIIRICCSSTRELIYASLPALVPVIAGVAIWKMSERLAVLVSREFIFSPSELEQTDEQEEADSEDDHADAVDMTRAPGDADIRWDSVMRVGIVLIGLYFAIVSLRDLVYNGIFFLRICRQPLANQFGGSQCPSVENSRIIAILLAEAVVLLVSLVLILRKDRIARFFLRREAIHHEGTADDDFTEGDEI